MQLSRFFEDAEIDHVQVALIKVSLNLVSHKSTQSHAFQQIDNDDYLNAAKRLEKAEECKLTMRTRRFKEDECGPRAFTRVVLDLSPQDVTKFLMAVRLWADYWLVSK